MLKVTLVIDAGLLHQRSFGTLFSIYKNKIPLLKFEMGVKWALPILKYTFDDDLFLL